MCNLTVVVCSVLFAGLAWAQPSPVAEKKPATPEALKAEIEALKPAQLAWREIQWKTCLLEGLREARDKKKPILLWVVGPGDALDGRCWVCAGAVRETVFSNAEVIRRINVDFVPVSLAMAAFQARSADDEGKALQSIYRSKTQPQGTCVLNSGGQVLAWTVMFDKDKSVLDFLDRGLKRFGDHPDAKEAIMTERYMRFPSAKLADMKDEAKPNPIADHHADGKHCPGWVELPRGTIVAKVIGRALDKEGKPSARMVNQEHLALDRFEVPPSMQEKVAQALADGGAGRVALPDNFAQLCMAHAFLGNKDSAPMSKVTIFRIAKDVKQCEFWAQTVDGAKDLWRVEGKTDISGKVVEAADRGLHHEVKLTWEGYIELDGKRITRLLLGARGTEKLKWGSEALKARAKTDDEVAFLVAGRFIDMECGVRYGVIGEPVPNKKATR